MSKLAIVPNYKTMTVKQTLYYNCLPRPIELAKAIKEI